MTTKIILLYGLFCLIYSIYVIWKYKEKENNKHLFGLIFVVIYFILYFSFIANER